MPRCSVVARRAAWGCVSLLASLAAAQSPLESVIPQNQGGDASARFRFFVRDDGGRVALAPKFELPQALPGMEDPRLTHARAVVSTHVFGMLPVQRRLELAARLAPADADGQPYQFGPWDLLPPATEHEYLAMVAQWVTRDVFFAMRPVHQRALITLAARRARGEEPIACCFVPGTDPAVIEAFNAVMFPEVPAFQQTSRWSTTATNGGGVGTQGLPITLTYSFVPDGTQIADGGFGAGPSNLNAFLTGIYGSTTAWQQIYHAMFQTWGSFCGVTYVFEPNDDGIQTNISANAGIVGVRGDCRMAGKALDGNSGVLAYNNFPNNGDMVIDTADNFYSTVTNDSRRLRNVLFHEHGHGMGQAHVCPANSTKLMEPFISTAYFGPQFDDILNAQRHYGDASEPNDNAASATVLPSVGTTLQTLRRQSIDDSADTDYFSFSVTGPSRITATARPTGAPYVQGPQTNPCDSSGASTFDPRNIHNLIVNLIGTNGSTILATANDSDAGEPETLSAVISAPGTHFIRVLGGSADSIQNYDLEYTLIPGGVVVSLPSGAPGEVAPGIATSFPVSIQTIGETLVGTPVLRHRSSSSSAYAAANLTFVSGTTWTATLPAQACDDTPQFYVEAQGSASGFARSPANAPTSVYSAIVGAVTTALNDNAQSNLGWTLGVLGDTATSGIWERGDPVGTTSGGAQVQPESGFDTDGPNCFFTGNAAVGAGAGTNDVDGGFTTLLSPLLNLANAAEVTVSFNRWYSNARGNDPNNDTFRVDVSNNNGASWVNARTVGPASENDGGWIADSFVLSSLVAPTSAVRIRFVADDAGTGSLVEAAVDNIVVSVRACTDPPPSCAADFNGDGNLDPDDLADFITCFFTQVQMPGLCVEADFNGDSNVDPDDLADFITAFFAGC